MIENKTGHVVALSRGATKVWTIDNPDSIQKYYSEKVGVQATVDSTKNSIHVDKVKQLYNTDT